MRINTIRLRVLIGVLAILLPWLVAILTRGIPPSISETYYTNAGTVFIIILGWASGTLISYKGYELIDDIVLTVSGILGFCICIFPCYTIKDISKVGVFLLDKHTSDIIHCICAVVFFGLLAYNSLFLFTKHVGDMTQNKKRRNTIYIICGICMMLSFTIMLLPTFRIQFWLTETLALFFFGVSFLTKANIFRFLFCDNK